VFDRLLASPDNESPEAWEAFLAEIEGSGSSGEEASTAVLQGLVRGRGARREVGEMRLASPDFVMNSFQV